MSTIQLIGELLSGFDYVIAGRPMFERISNEPIHSERFSRRRCNIRISGADVTAAVKKLTKHYNEPIMRGYYNGMHGMSFRYKNDENFNLSYGYDYADMIAWNIRSKIPDYVEVVDGVRHLNPLYMLGKCLQLDDVEHGLIIYNYLRNNGKSHADCENAVITCGITEPFVFGLLHEIDTSKRNLDVFLQR